MVLELNTFRNRQQTRTGVLGYLRVSKEEQADRRNSLEEQKRRIREHFEGRLGLRILGWYADEGASAYKDDEKREDFWRMIERAKTDPRVGIIAVDEESRFYRHKYKAAAIKGELMEYGVQVQTVRRNADPRTVAGLWMESIEETMAHAHSLMNRDYTLRGMAGNVRGRDPETGWAFKNGGPAPYGWTARRINMGRDAKGRPIGRTIWELDPETSQVRRQVLLWRKNGWTYEQIRDELNRQGIPAPRGGLWATTTIVGMLREDMVWTAAGYTVWNKHYRKGPRPKGEKFKPVEEWAIEPNAHPAIITDDEAKVILAVGKERRKTWEQTRGNHRRSDYLLSGDNLAGEPMFLCLGCGGRLVGNRAGRGRPKYLCSTAKTRGNAGCVKVWVDKQDVETRILSYIERRMLTEDYIRSVLRAAREATAVAAQTTPPEERRIREIDRQIERIKKAILAGSDPADWVAEMTALKEERKRLEESLGHCKPEPKLEIDENEAPRVLARLQEYADSADIDKRRRFVQGFVRQVTLDPETRKVTVEFLPDPSSPLHPVSLLLGVESGGLLSRPDMVPPTGFEPVPPP